MLFPSSFRTKSGLLPSFVLFLSFYLFIVLWLLCQSSDSTSSLLLANHRSIILEHSLVVSLFLSRSRAHAFPLVETASFAVGDAEEEVLGEFLSASSRKGFWHQQSDRQWHRSQETYRIEDREKLRTGVGAMEWVGLPLWALAHSERSWHVSNRYVQDSPGADSHDLKILKNFVRMMTYGIDDFYDDLKAGEKFVLQYWKDFTVDWRRHASLIPLETTQFVTNVGISWLLQLMLWVLRLISLQFIKKPLRTELDLAHRKRIRSYDIINHFIHLGTQLWEKDWQIYDKSRIRVNTWAKIQLYVFTSVRVGEYIEFICRAGSDRGLYYRVSIFRKLKWIQARTKLIENASRRTWSLKSFGMSTEESSSSFRLCEMRRIWHWRQRKDWSSQHSELLCYHILSDSWFDEQVGTFRTWESEVSTTFLQFSAHDAGQSHRE